MAEDTFGLVLCQLRKKQAMTQKELAKKLHVHITTIKNWEGGGCYPDAKNVCALADLFHVTTDYLLGRENKSTITLDGLTAAENRQLLHIIQAYMDALPRKTRPPKNR